MSGSCLSHFAVDQNPTKYTQSVAVDSGCPTNNTVEMVRCLRELPTAKIIEYDRKS